MINRITNATVRGALAASSAGRAIQPSKTVNIVPRRSALWNRIRLYCTSQSAAALFPDLPISGTSADIQAYAAMKSLNPTGSLANFWLDFAWLFTLPKPYLKSNSVPPANSWLTQVTGGVVPALMADLGLLVDFLETF